MLNEMFEQLNEAETQKLVQYITHSFLYYPKIMTEVGFFENTKKETIEQLVQHLTETYGAKVSYLNDMTIVIQVED